jgi:hypothetical protein
VALKRSGRVREPEEATESMSWTHLSAKAKRNSSSASTDFGKESSASRLLPIRPSTSKNAEGSEAFWTQAKPEPAGRARQAGRANQTFEPIEPPWQAIREWVPADDGEPVFDLFNQRADSGTSIEIPCEDGTILVLESD